MQIPPNEWSEFFEDFGLEHTGWLTFVEIVGPHRERSVERHECTLDFVETELDEEASSVVIGFADDKPLRIAEPRRVSFDKTEEGQDDLLEIESPSETIVLRLRFPMEEDMFEDRE